MLRDDLVGKEIGEFRIERRIGRGGMASVYRAFQPSVNRYVALKVIPYDPDGENEEFRRRFAQEAAVVASLEHPHILPVYAYGVAEGKAYLAMRLLTGGTLNDLLTDGALDMELAAHIFGQIARGLAHAHSKGVIHRDLKPSNILLDEDGNAYLTDFGLAKWVEGSQELTKTGNIVGTPAYMSPEQLRGEVLDQRADIYSMGIILYHMMVGRQPFETTTTDVVAIMYQHLEKQPLGPREINPNIPPAVEAVILRALEKDPNKRYADVRHMAEELDVALGRKTGSTYGTPTPFPRPTPRLLPKTAAARRQQQRNVLMLVGMAVVIMLALTAAFVISQQNQPVPKAVVEAGVEASANELIPTEVEIAAALRALGGGFVAYVTCNQTSEYHATQVREMGDMARRLGLDYRVYDSDSDKYNQLTQIERARTDGAKVLIVCPLDVELLRDSLASVQEARIPLVLMSSSTPSYGGVLIVGDEYLMGKKPGEVAGQIIANEKGGTANVIILDWPDLPQLVVRADGLEEGMLSYAPQANVIGRFRGATREFGQESVAKLLAEGVQFDVILSINDAGSFGAIKALEEAGIPEDRVIIVSVDAEVQARDYIQQGHYLRASVDPGREEFSRAAINAVIKLLAGGTLPEHILVPPGAVITRETLTTVDETR